MTQSSMSPRLEQRNEPSIQECPHCYEEVDGRARVCPHCRKRLDTKSGRYQTGSLVGAIGLLALVGGLMAGSMGAIGFGALILIIGLGIRGS